MSRKVSIHICQAFLRKEKKTIDNSHTDGNALYLFGNKIAEYRGAVIWVTFAGWQTNTTKERLNTLCNEARSPIGFSQAKGQLYAGCYMNDVVGWDIVKVAIGTKEWVPINDVSAWCDFAAKHSLVGSVTVHA